MDDMQKEYLARLTIERMKDAESLERPSLRGVKNSVVEKYSDQAHFIYELLQNADDAKATSAQFKLFNNKLVFSHNGTRRFEVSNPDTEFDDNGNLGDLNAITSIGASNKKDRSTIGKFGVGFKAVFQYTSTPHIYDPNVFFKIERFIVPIELHADYPNRRKNDTLFVIPFDHEQRSEDESFADISDKLLSLDFPLLFLQNLKNIDFEIKGVVGLYGKEIKDTRRFGDTTAEFIELIQNNGENREDFNENRLWLFTRKEENKLPYSVGFFVDGNDQLIPKTHSAFCFFPTKEVTGLNFIIHSAFLLTDSREGILAGNEHNIEMISLLSQLAADSIVYLRDIGKSNKLKLINDNILQIIPFEEGIFRDVTSNNVISFKPFYTAIRNTFETEEIIPSIGDSYVTSENAYWGGSENYQLAEIFSNKQLAFLTKNDKAKWAFSSLSTPRGLKISSYGYIASIVNNKVNSADVIDYVRKTFIKAQTIDWLHSFYKYISTSKDRKEQIRTKPIFIDTENTVVAAYDERGRSILFLPTEGGNGYTVINEVLLKNNETREFIIEMGVREPALKDEIYQYILPKYMNDSVDEPLIHFKKFFQFYNTCSQIEVVSFFTELKKYDFILSSSNKNPIERLSNPNELYFPIDTLKKWFINKPETMFVCYDKYLDLVEPEDVEQLDDFLNDLGVRKIPRILEYELSEEEVHRIKPKQEWPVSSIYGNQQQSWSESYIDGLSENMSTVLFNEDSETSKLMWDQLLLLVEQGIFRNKHSWTQDSILFGKYYYYYAKNSRKLVEFESNVSKLLRNERWLTNVHGEFLVPNQITRETLHQQYDISSNEAFELIQVLEMDSFNDGISLVEYGKNLELSDEEQRRALEEYAKKKNLRNVSDKDEGNTTNNKEPMNRFITEIIGEAKTSSKSNSQKKSTLIDEEFDEDEYTRTPFNIEKKIKKVMDQAKIQAHNFAHLDELRSKAMMTKKYTYGWFKTLLELESVNNYENSDSDNGISISFSKVELEEGTSRTLVLKHPNRHIPASMEDLSDIPLELIFAELPQKKVAVEVVNVKSYTLRAKLRSNVDIEGVDLSQVVEARIVARNPVFLVEELRKAFVKLGNERDYADEFNMQKHLCENIEFVFGPPGTGKTTHIANNVIVPLVRSEESIKILILTPTNKAADVLTRKIMDSMQIDLSYLDWLVRFGITNDSIIENSGVFRDKTFDIRAFSKNVTVTTIARFPYDYFIHEDGHRYHLSELKWDYIIIDEASMIPIANIIYPLYKKSPEKFIIAGDPFQIQPITSVDIWKNENIYTMVGLNSFTDPKTVPHDYKVVLLTTQYRSIPEIGEVFSHLAYGGILRHHRLSDSQRSLPIEGIESLNIIKFPVSKYESIYRPKRLQRKTPYQVYTALFSYELLKYLSSIIGAAASDKRFNIGLIAPYRAQADLIDKLIASAELPKNVEVQVGTIHGFQGDECDVIIAVYNPPPKISNHPEMFLNKLNIINVSISRARDYLIILMPDDDTENVEDLKLVKTVERLCKKQTTYTEQLSQVIEDKIFGSKTYLEDNSFSTSHQLVNVYGRPEMRYEVRSEDNAVDIQVHEEQTD